jgi:hypothetical protein
MFAARMEIRNGSTGSVAHFGAVKPAGQRQHVLQVSMLLTASAIAGEWLPGLRRFRSAACLAEFGQAVGCQPHRAGEAAAEPLQAVARGGLLVAGFDGYS